MQRRSQTVQNTGTTMATPSSSVHGSVPMTPSTTATPNIINADAVQLTMPATPTNVQVNTPNIPTVPEEIVRQFPQVGQGMLAWFATPPVDVVKPSQPFHSVTYLAYKQRQRIRKNKSSIAPSTDKGNHQKRDFIAKRSGTLASMSAHERTRTIVHALKEFTKQQEHDIEAMKASLDLSK
ncbi:hypothetical protein BDF22DRAFT_777669 [Syncephalis plumigaleata]|nr:hypothetical protein BDF22DRAFT_777669 [Syncephalis plumigaleata]